jgi:hypothetical protein
MSGLNALRCFKCGAYDGIRNAVVFEATAEEVFVKEVPVGVGLCSDCSFMTDYELELAELVANDPAHRARVEALRRMIAAELELDLEHDAKEWASWSNKFGGW